MKLTDEAKRDILNFVLERVANIANKEYQKRIWIRGEGPEVDDFDETACHFLHEGGGVLEEYKEFGITESQYYLLKSLRDEFQAFSNKNNWPQDFIDTPEWGKIMNLAKEVLKAFHYQKQQG